MSTMKAIRIHEYGGPEVLRYEDVSRPEPGEGEVLVRVRAAGINPLDIKVRKGLIQSTPPRFPMTLGRDLSGTIEQLGSGVSGFEIGDGVFARVDASRDGAYAEYCVVRAQDLAKKPTTVDHTRAASVPVAGLAAWEGLFAPNVRPDAPRRFSIGQSVLIHGGGGGVGSFAVQIAKCRGARVITTARGEDFGMLRELGADQLIDYRKSRFEELVSDVDLVLDLVGGEVQDRSWQVLKPGGVLVSTVSLPSESVARERAVHAAVVGGHSGATQLAELARMIDTGALQPVVSQIFPLTDARAAHEKLEAGQVRGKLVLRVGT